MKIVCKFCNIEFRGKSRRKYCSSDCFSKRNKCIPLKSGWSGGWYKDQGGWIRLRIPDHPNADSGGYVKEHRYVMEKHIGRLLLRSEIIDHINGIKDDNRIENLRILSHSEHSRIGYNPGRFKAGIKRGPLPQYIKEAISRKNKGRQRTPEQLARIIAAQNRERENREPRVYTCVICEKVFHTICRSGGPKAPKFCSRQCRRKSSYLSTGR